jgi:acyl dehydratase
VRFADFQVGQVIEAGPATVSEAEILEFATRYDPQWFHVDPERAAEGPHGGLIASGWQTCGIAMRLAVDAALHDSESFASPGLAYLNWRAPVRPGDALTLKATVLEARRTSKGYGALRWHWALSNQDGVVVLDLEATSLFK